MIFFQSKQFFYQYFPEFTIAKKSETWSFLPKDRVQKENHVTEGFISYSPYFEPKFKVQRKKEQ